MWGAFCGCKSCLLISPTPQIVELVDHEAKGVTLRHLDCKPSSCPLLQ
ncbi:hypothetical protein I314_03595 [Cryptococcus bacillisporus CA1873]|uniref:Uncharacterized protein n=2 Tax=Cryptococcus gattii TaxID=552467 RepID=A0A0D0TKU6_CRYGA|nr:hypothetical protein I312_03406 [Cryptococcus bacillisporus CA1280]KIR60304.1 hypothetical protein I314_03595 [Cryptococcus bacillisporus CA1873]|eukprot:KIR60304.1 hypothetical protein I314_03595 [Cryptococcus gattii CA1873]